MVHKRAAAAASAGSSGDDAVALVEALHSMAVRYEQHGFFLQAIKVLNAICSLDLLPAVLARHTLHLARLLIEHTENRDEARRILENAQRNTANLPGFYGLKCEIHCWLAKNYQKAGSADAAATTCRAAITICSSGIGSSERDVLIQWQCYFWQQLADSQIILGDPDEATSCLEQGLQVAQQHGLKDQQVMFHLFRLQLHLLYWEKNAASSVIEHLKVIVEDSQWPQDMLLFQQQARLHFKILQVLYMVRVGYFDVLSSKPRPGSSTAPRGPLSDIHELLPQVEKQSAQYCWMPMPMVRATVLLLEATVSKSDDRASDCLAAVAEGLQLVEQQLLSLGITEAVREEDMPLSVVWDCRVPLVLRVLLLECRAQVHLLRCNFIAAQDDIIACVGIIDRCPQLLVSFMSSVHMLLGMYAHATGAALQACSHYAAVRPEGQHVPESEAAMSSALQVLALLASGEPDALGSCANLLSGISSDDHRLLGYSERGALLLATGMLKLQQGHGDKAKSDLTRALKLAHGRLGNHQMVAQVLTLMAPLQHAQGDTSGAESMISSACTLTKAISDGWSQSVASATAAQLFEAAGSSEGAAKVAKHREIHSSKQHEVVVQQQLVLQRAAEHSFLLGWGLPGS